ncbi:MAG: hypothetical protein QOE41_2985, partial [Mycobacterium sp.]|nr:hypothetical protein [Mycobacterium sp.]
AHAAGLVQHLQSHPDALTSGEATGPSALRALLDVLAAEHPGVQRARCHSCGAQRVLPYRQDGASICGRCYSRTHRKVCVRCGELGRPDSQEDGGVVCSRCKIRDPARSDACAACGKTTRVAYRVDGQPFCQTCGPRKLYTCSSCGRENCRAHAFSTQGPLCPRCYQRGREHECVQCGRTTVHARVADRDAGTWICHRCWVPPLKTCNGCGQIRPCARGSASGRPICATCRAHRCRPRTCAMCERTVAIQTTLPLGAVCGPCYRQLRRSPAPCASCQEVRPLVGVRDGGGSVCGPCSGDGRKWICDRCGQVDLLIGGTHCLACTTKARVRQLLTGPDGEILTQLEGVATFLLEDNTAERTQEILNGSAWIQVLRDLVATGNPITHQVLDELPQDNRVGHLRNILVHAGALYAQAEGLESLGPWLKSFLAGLSPGTAQLLRPYASWSVLPRTRHRAARLKITASAPMYARARIETTAHFLTWLEDNGRSLADTTQHDVDAWIGLGASTRRRVRDFLRWAHARGLSAELQVHWLGSEGLPENVLGDDERWTLLRRCLRDDTLALRLRVAGALVLLYGQIFTRIVELTVDSVTTTETDTCLALRDQPVLLPPPLAALTLELAARSTHEQSTRTGTAAWLFPGARPGSHFYAGRLSTALNKKLGIFIRPARGAALSALAADLPAPVLADLLGLSITTATRWGALAARDNAEYIAARIESPPARTDGVQSVIG